RFTHSKRAPARSCSRNSVMKPRYAERDGGTGAAAGPRSPGSCGMPWRLDKRSGDQTVRTSFPLEGVAKVRMGERNHRLGPLRDRLSLEIDHPVLGDHEHHVASRRGDDVAGCEAQDDAAGAHTVTLVRRRHADERLSAIRRVTGANEL